MRLKKQKQEKPLCQKIVIADKENDDPNCEFYYLKPAVLKAKEEEVHENEEEEEEEEKKTEEEPKTNETEQNSEENKDNKINEIKTNENSEEHKNNSNAEINANENETKTEELPAKKEEVKEKTIYNPIRQPFCFIYQITKSQK